MQIKLFLPKLFQRSFKLVPMSGFNFEEEQSVYQLVELYENMAAEGSVGFMENEAFEKIIEYYEERLLFDKALKVSEAALAQHAFNSRFYIQRARIFSEQGHYQIALDELERASLYDASELDIHLCRAEVFLQLQDFNAAMEVLFYALDLAGESDAEEVHLLFATLYEEQDDFINCFRHLGKALRYNPENEVALQRLLLCAENGELYQQSVSFHQKFIDLQPYSYWAWYNLGKAQYQLGLYEKAIEAFDYALIIQNDFEEAYRDCAMAYLQLDQLEQALRCYQEALQYIKPDELFWLRMGRLYEWQEEYHTARSCYSRAYRLDQQCSEAHYRMGRCFFKEEHWAEALRRFQKAFRLEPENADYAIALGDTYYELDDLPAAEKQLRVATELQPEYERAWIAYLEFFLDELRYDEALQELERAKRYAYCAAFDYIRVVALLGKKHRKAALLALVDALQNDASMHDYLFDFFPELKTQSEVLALIAEYHPGKEDETAH